MVLIQSILPDLPGLLAGKFVQASILAPVGSTTTSGPETSRLGRVQGHGHGTGSHVATWTRWCLIYLADLPV